MNRRIKKKKTMQRLQAENRFVREQNMKLVARDILRNNQIDELYNTTYAVIGAVILASGKDKLTLSQEDITEILRKNKVVIEEEDGAFTISVVDRDGKETE